MNKLQHISKSSLPTDFGNYDIHIYKDANTSVEHVALVMGKVNGEVNVLTRVHSECLTGDVFSSSRCDCGEQLKLAQQLIEKEGCGIVIYLRDHEGRGIGLSNKIRAYSLQDGGLDTVEANLALGLPIDNRSFEIASDILKEFEVSSIKLMTNNPQKDSALKALGIKINDIVPLRISPNKFNINYLQTKEKKLGHFLKN